MNKLFLELNHGSRDKEMNHIFDELGKRLVKCAMGGLACLAATAQICVSAALSDANWFSMGGIRGTYDRYEYLDEKRQAFEALAGLVKLILKTRMRQQKPR